MHQGMTRRTVLAGGVAIASGGLLGRPGKADNGIIRIGVLTDMGGTYSALTGPGSVVGAQLAIEDFTKQHPDIAVELVSADLQLKPDVALAIAGDWFDSKGVDLLTDVPLSSAAIAIGEMAKAKDKLAIYTGAASSALTGQHCGPNHLHWAYDTWGIPHSIVQTVVKGGGDTWFFITADYAFGQQLARDSASFVTAAGGKVLGEARHPFPGTTDFSAFLVEAKASGAKVIGFANGGTDSENCIKQAAEFGFVEQGIKVVGVGLLINDIQGIGLDAARGVLLAEPYYWNLNDQTRAFGRRFAARMSTAAMPNSAQGGQYSAISHYLKAVAAMGVARAKASGRAVIEQMRAIPIEDAIFGKSVIRPDGRVIHNVYLFEAKSPKESKEKWDLLTLKATVPAEQAFRPMSEGGCPMVHV
ncbi:MAG: ABC transporter substrate-binding protein [Alphaproteobacteria bacterium]|nr:ABC transporter substrate-binding protein [Alphaproteobacteria bacterium]